MVQRSLAKLFEEYEGRIRLVFKDRPLSMHTLARPAHEAARCAGAAGKYWPYHDRLFAEQPSSGAVICSPTRASSASIPTRSRAVLDERRFAADVERDIEQAQALGINSTPTFLINGRPVIGATSIEEFRAAIDKALQERR